MSQGVGENEFDRIVYHRIGNQQITGLDGTVYTYAVPDTEWEPVFTTFANTTTGRVIPWGDTTTADYPDWGSISDLENLRNSVLEIEKRLDAIETKEPEPLTMDEIASLFEEG